MPLTLIASRRKFPPHLLARLAAALEEHLPLLRNASAAGLLQSIC